MPIKYDELMALKNLGQKYAYSDREVMLYAYGIGMGADQVAALNAAFAGRSADHRLGRVRRGRADRGRRSRGVARGHYRRPGGRSPSWSADRGRPGTAGRR